MAIYMIRAGEDGPVKIGCADDPEGRLIYLQGGNHLELSIIRLMPGGIAVERQLHQTFADQRIRGEWFWFHPDMLTINPSEIEETPKFGCRRVEAEPPQSLIEEIEAFALWSGLSESTIGGRAVKDSRFVSRLRSGKAVTMNNVERIRQFMREYVPIRPTA